MNKRRNSILQKALKLASELEVFDIKDLLEAFPDAKEATLKRYLMAMIKNGNLIRDETELSVYIFVSDKPIKVRIGE